MKIFTLLEFITTSELVETGIAADGATSMFLNSKSSTFLMSRELLARSIMRQTQLE